MANEHSRRLRRARNLIQRYNLRMGAKERTKAELRVKRAKALLAAEVLAKD